MLSLCVVFMEQLGNIYALDASIVKSKFDPSPQGGLRGGEASVNSIYNHSIIIYEKNIIRKKGEIIIFSKTWQTVTIGICLWYAHLSFRYNSVSSSGYRSGQWNVTLPSHPLVNVAVAKMLWQCVFKVSSDFLRNINKIVCPRRPSGIL